MARRFFVVGFAILCAACANCQDRINVPYGKAILVDGQIDPGEWDDATVKMFGEDVRLHVKRSQEYVWLAIELMDQNDGAADLYVSPSANEIFDLHASAKLGERKLESGRWSEWKWWNNRNWVANTSRVDSFAKPNFLPTKVREYQIRRDKFPAASWKVMFEVLTPAEPEWKSKTYPAGARTTDTRTWITLVVDSK
ncbi:MAG: hypothetical protein ACHP9V_03355 [Terriglobales bacterium]